MVWFKVDDKFHSHNKVRKVLADDPAAIALWVVAGSWSADNLTDGFVPDHQLPWLIPTGADTLAQKLVTAGLWRRVRVGYKFHEWQENGDGTRRNPSKQEVEETRRKKAEAGRRGGLASGNVRSKREASASASASASAEALAKGLVEPPTRPDQRGKDPPSPPRGKPGSRRAYGYDQDPDFQRFWSVYPQRAGKPAAFKAWQQALKRGAAPEAVIAAAQRYRDDPQRNPDKTKYPQGWLNDERYLDEGGSSPSAPKGWWDN
jgi:hypothetical protein